jgi:diguanylate cyclase
VAIALVDLDGFKAVNDRSSHAEGDDVLRVVASTLRNTLRGGDLVARYGGDEFVVILPGADLARATQAAETLRSAIAGAAFFDSDPENRRIPTALPSVTASIGVSSYREHLAPGGTQRRRESTFLRLADSAMYRAKAAGRNRVEVADPED